MRGVVRKIAVPALAALVAWKASVLGLGDAYRASDAAFAARLDPAHATAVLALANQAVDADAATHAAARDAVLGLLSTRPADGRLFRWLAVLDRDDPASTRRRWQAALQLRPADVAAREWLMDDAAAQGDLAAAAGHGDALLRVSPERAKSLFPLFSQWLQADAGAAALAAVLERRPAWRRSFVDFIARTGAEPSLYRFGEVVQALRRSAAPMDAAEAAPIVNRLVHERDVERAYLLWRSVLPPVQTTTGVLYNGGFELPASGAAFDWTLRATPGVAVSVDVDAPPRGKVLHLRFGGGRVADIAVAQTLLLPAGRFRLSGETRLDDLRSARGLEWRVQCAAEPPRLLAAGPVLDGSRDWSAFELAFDVPASGCPAQRLQLSTRARVAAERDVDGSAWFDDLAIAVRLMQRKTPSPD